MSSALRIHGENSGSIEEGPPSRSPLRQAVVAVSLRPVWRRSFGTSLLLALAWLSAWTLPSASGPWTYEVVDWRKPPKSSAAVRKASPEAQIAEQLGQDDNMRVPMSAEEVIGLYDSGPGLFVRMISKPTAGHFDWELLYRWAGGLGVYKSKRFSKSPFAAASYMNGRTGLRFYFHVPLKAVGLLLDPVKLRFLMGSISDFDSLGLRRAPDFMEAYKAADKTWNRTVLQSRIASLAAAQKTDPHVLRNQMVEGGGFALKNLREKEESNPGYIADGKDWYDDLHYSPRGFKAEVENQPTRKKTATQDSTLWWTWNEALVWPTGDYEAQEAKGLMEALVGLWIHNGYCTWLKMNPPGLQSLYKTLFLAKLHAYAILTSPDGQKLAPCFPGGVFVWMNKMLHQPLAWTLAASSVNQQE